MNKLVILILLFLFFLSCDGKKNNIPKFEDVYKKELSKLKVDQQFNLDKLELFFFSGKYDKKEVKEILSSFSKKLKYQKALYEIVLLNEEPKIKLDNKLYNLLMKFQDSKNVLKFLAKHYSKSRFSERTFYTLYALEYKFSKENYNDFLLNKNLKEFIELTIEKKINYCESGCSENLEDKDKYLNKIKDDFLKGKFSKKHYALYKDIISKKKKLSKLILENEKTIKKLKKEGKSFEIEEEDAQEYKETMNFYQKAENTIAGYFYFIDKSKKLKIENKFALIKELYVNKTPLNKKMTQFVIAELNKHNFLVQSQFYPYLNKFGDKKTIEKRWMKKKMNKYITTSGYSLYKYGFYKRNFLDKFKKLNPNIYKNNKFLYVKIKDFSNYYLKKLQKDPKNLKNLAIFQYAPKLLEMNFSHYIKLYTRNDLDKLSIVGKEDLYYLLLKISIKGKFPIPKEILKIGNSYSMVYFKLLDPFLTLK